MGQGRQVYRPFTDAKDKVPAAFSKLNRGFNPATPPVGAIIQVVFQSRHRPGDHPASATAPDIRTASRRLMAVRFLRSFSGLTGLAPTLAPVSPSDSSGVKR